MIPNILYPSKNFIFNFLLIFIVSCLPRVEKCQIGTLHITKCCRVYKCLENAFETVWNATR